MKRWWVLALTVLIVGGLTLEADLPKPQQVPGLIKKLKDADAKVRLAAAEDLGHLGAVKAAAARPAVPTLVEVVKKDSDVKVRKAALAALGKMDPDAKLVVPALVEMVKNDKEEKSLRLAAITAIGGIGPNAKSAAPVLDELRKKELKKDEKERDRALMQAAGDALQAIRAK